MATQASGMTVTEDNLKRRTGEFDLEAIAILDLSDQGLRDVGAVPHCLFLRLLNLSCNHLEDVQGLTSLSALEELDLSANNITNLKGFDRLEKLQRLDLPGNNLSQLESLLPLCGLPHLKTLSLQLLGTSLSNPLCSSAREYAAFMSHSFPNLHWLDGERVDGELWRERGDLEPKLKKLETVGNDSTVEEISDEAPDPLMGFSLSDEQAMGKIKRLLSECSHTSQRVQEHIHNLQQELLN